MIAASPLETQLSMYVCVNYIKPEKKLRIMVGRPNYNSRNLEAATIVISAGIYIDETEGGMGPFRFDFNLDLNFYFISGTTRWRQQILMSMSNHCI